MARFENCEKAVKDFAERFSVQNPKDGDIDSLQVGSVNVPAGTRVILDFVVEDNFVIHVKKIFVDKNLNTNYIFLVRSVKYEGNNFLPFSVPQQETEEISLIIENFGAGAQDYDYYIQAWGRRR